MKGACKNLTEAVAVSRTNPKSFVASPIVTIYIGEEECQRFAHKALLMAYSSFFDACLRSAFKEGQNLVVKLDDITTHVFDAFLCWLYTGDLNVAHHELIGSDFHGIEVYKLADRLLIPELKNNVVDRLRCSFRNKKQIPTPYNIVKVSQAGLLGSELGRFFIRHFIYSINEGQWNLLSKLPNCEGNEAAVEMLGEDNDALMAVVKEMIRYQSTSWHDPLLAHDCEFHEHVGGQKCPRKDVIRNYAAAKGVARHG